MIWWLIGGVFIGAGIGLMIGGMLGRASMRDEMEDAWYRHLRRQRDAEMN